ncbi:hypothetical protein QJQ45_009549 [Haematococcus lacustris]|nr:hypothetical protein QJQ45_009549 [Haematococcus lacustris]
MPRVLPQYAMQLSRPRLQSAIKAGKDSKKDLLKKREEVAAIADKDLYNTPEVRALLLLAASSYWKHTGKYLIEAPFEALTTAVFNAPFALLMHDRFQEGVTDPRFMYANRAALNLFEASWSELIGCPSRKSAADEAGTQQERQQLLDQAATSGIITNYSGWRVSLKGKRFRECTVES